MKYLYEFLEKINIDPGLRASIVTGMSYHLQVTNPATSNFRCLVPCGCAESQRQIGWISMMRGMLSDRWCIIQESVKVEHIAGDKCGAKVVNWCIEKSYKRWKTRNAAVHHTDENDRENQEDEEVTAQIERMYRLADEIGADDREFLGMPIEQRHQQHRNTKRQWIAITTPTLVKCANDFRTRLAKGYKDKRTMFVRTNKHTNQHENNDNEQQNKNDNHQDTQNQNKQKENTRNQEEDTTTPGQLAVIGV